MNKVLVAGSGCCVLALFPVIFGIIIAVVVFSVALSGTGGSGGSGVASACGVADLAGAQEIIPKLTGKLGHEDHLSDVKPPGHYVGPDSDPLTIIGAGSFSPHTQDQEHWYFNTRWKGYDWSNTHGPGGNADCNGPIGYPTVTDQALYNTVAHKKIIIRSKETGKQIVVSAEEGGPAICTWYRDGINFGAPPEVYKYLGTGEPYGNPSSSSAQIEVLGLASDSTPLGPCN